MYTYLRLFILLVLSISYNQLLHAANENDISIVVTARDFYKNGENNLCFIFTGNNINGRVENPSARPCNATSRTNYAFVGDRSWRNFKFVTDKYGHTWISEIQLTTEFMQDFFRTASVYSPLRREGIVIKTSLIKTIFPTFGLGETHTLTFAEPFKVDIDWSASVRHRSTTYRQSDYQASFVIKIQQYQHFTADDDGIPRTVIPQ